MTQTSISGSLPLFPYGQRWQLVASYHGTVQPGMEFRAPGGNPVIRLPLCFSVEQTPGGACSRSSSPSLDRCMASLRVPLRLHPLPCTSSRGRQTLCLSSLLCCCVSFSTFLQGLWHDKFKNACPALSLSMPLPSVPFPWAREMCSC